MENKTIYLIKMGMDTNEGLNHRIRFISKNWTYKGEQVEVCIDFMLCTPWTLKKSKNGKPKTIRGIENSGLGLDFQYTDSKGSWGLSHIFKEVVKTDLEYCETPFNNYLKYSYDNILKIINFLLKANYNEILLINSSFIKNFNYDTFFSDEYDHDQETYKKAIDFKEIAQTKIKQIKSECKYDNSSYYYDGNVFKIIVHYNCYNDYLTFDLDNWDKAIKQINDYKMPEDKIRLAISQHGIKSSKLYC